MKVGDFQKAINVTSNSYSRFMSQNGPDKGAGSNVYMAAWAFCKKREMRGIKTVANKKAKTVEPGSKDAVPSVEDVVLEGEMEDGVAVYGKLAPTTSDVCTVLMKRRIDTCDEIRRKINAHLKKASVTQASLLREIAACYHTAPKKPQSSQLAAFRSKKGPYAGNTSAIFYGAYVYFEKLRIKEGKPKSKKRVEMEGVHGLVGMDTERKRNRILCRAGERPVMDKYGQFSFL